MPPLPSGPVAGLFPGQGSQTPGMRDAVAELAPHLLARCLELVGEDPFGRIAESTRFAQPAIFCASVAFWIALERSLQDGELDGAWRPSVLAGHSLGERDGGGGLVAIVGADAQQCEQLAAAHGASVANDNAPGQIVLAGSRQSLRELVGAARATGVRAIMLDVAGAFHSPAMASAVEPFRDLLDTVEISTPRVPVISCASAKPIADVRGELAQGIVRPVRWRETMLALSRQSAQEFLDLGPGKVLAGLVARNLPDVRGIQAQTLIGRQRSVEVAA